MPPHPRTGVEGKKDEKTTRVHPDTGTPTALCSVTQNGNSPNARSPEWMDKHATVDTLPRTHPREQGSSPRGAEARHQHTPTRWSAACKPAPRSPTDRQPGREMQTQPPRPLPRAGPLTSDRVLGGALPGARVRNSACGKGHEEGGSAYAKAGSSLRSPLEILEHLPPKPESAYFTALCSHLHL